MSEAAPPNLRTSERRFASLRFVMAEGIGLRIVVAVVLSLICAAALVLLGPGAWSVDARLFGWKRIDIRDPRSHDSSRA